MSAVVVERISKRFGEFVAVDGLSFEVPEGVIYGVLGPNGAGKSTTLRMLTDIIAADEGSIRLFGSLPPGREASQQMGYLPEERGLYSKMGVADTLIFFAELRGLRRSRAKELAGEWLERLGLADWAQKRVNELSKGMQQKVQFATTFLHGPKLVILDEPWSGLDPINAEVLREVVLEQKAKGTTILFSTHLMEQAEKICDRVCIIAGGTRVAEGEVDALKQEAASGMVRFQFRTEADRDRAVTGPFSDTTLVAQHTAVEGASPASLVEVVPDTTPEAVLRALLDAEVPLAGYEAAEPSLHQIFIDRVGDAGGPRNPEAR